MISHVCTKLLSLNYLNTINYFLEKKTFDNLVKWIKFVEKVQKCIFVIIGNKQDLQEERVYVNIILI
jgi:hypothetical protein